MATIFHHPVATAMPAIHHTKRKRDMKFFSFTNYSSGSRKEEAVADGMLSPSPS